MNTSGVPVSIPNPPGIPLRIAVETRRTSVEGRTAPMTGGSQIYKWNEAIKNREAVSGVIGSVPAPGPNGSLYVARSVASGLPVIKRN